MVQNRHRKLISGVLSALLLTVAWSAPPAAAGTYTVHGCRVPSGTPAPTDGWSSLVAGQARPFNTCSRGGAFGGALDHRLRHNGTHGYEAIFRAPANTAISSYVLYRSAQIQPATEYRYLFNAFEAARDPAHLVDVCDGVTGCRGVGDRGKPLAGVNRLARSPLGGTRELFVGVYCRFARPGGPACSPGADEVAALQIHRSDVTLLDPSAPAFLGEPAAALANRKRSSGVVDIDVSATDSGSGVAEVAFEADGNVIARGPLDTNGGKCAKPYTAVVPCRLRADGTLPVDTSQLRDGQHLVRLLASDAAGNVTATAPVSMRTANGPCAAPSRAASVKLSAGLRGGHRSQSVRYGRGAVVRGRLADRKGRGVAGARICVIERLDSVRSTTKHRFVTTDRAGRYSVRLKRGPSRRVRLVNHVPGSGAAQAEVALRVHAALNLRADRNALRTGDWLTVRGRLAGGHVPRGGVLVAVEARRGAGWQHFGFARANRSGRYAFRYQFTRTTGVQRYRLRAAFKRQAGYPYSNGTSRSVVVRVSE